RVATGVVLAAHDVPAEGRRAAALDRAHHLELAEAQVTAIGLTPSGPVVAEDIRDLQAHVGTALCWRPLRGQRQQSEGAQQHDDLAAAQTGAVGDTERGLVLETGAGCGLNQPGDLLASKNPRQLPRIVRAGQLMGEVGAPERDGEEEAQRRGLRIHFRWLRTLLDLCELQAADIVAVRSIGGPAEKSGEGLDMP